MFKSQLLEIPKPPFRAIFIGGKMANRIKIRHGNSIPTTSSLLPYELGWNTVNKILYINDNNNAIEGIGLRYINTTDSTTCKFGRNLVCY